MLERQPYADDHAGPYFLWPPFLSPGHPLLDFYRETGIGELAGQLLRADLAVQDPGFAQVATRIPPWPHRPGGPHVDGLTPGEADGRPGTFSLLAGVWLTEHDRRHRGNLWVWPGTRLRFGQNLAERGAEALARVEEMNPGPYPKIELGEPTQAVVGGAGGVLFVHYLLAHNIGDHDGAADAGRCTTGSMRAATGIGGARPSLIRSSNSTCRERRRGLGLSVVSAGPGPVGTTHQVRK